MTRPRRPGVTGLKVLSAIPRVPCALYAGRHVDRLAFDERHDRLLEIRARARPAAEALQLARHANGVHGLDLDLEERLDRRLDLGLGGIERHAEGHLAVLRAARRLFGDG